MTAMIALHRTLQTWKSHVDVFIALSDFQKNLMAKAGLSEEAIQVKPQFYPDPPNTLSWERRENKVVFVGRLGEEKGIKVLLEVWRAWGDNAPPLEIIGDGPLKKDLSEMAIKEGLDNRVIFRGQLPFKETQQCLSSGRLLVLPSLWFEGFPMVVREALALGVPVAASRIGPLPDIVEEGVAGTLAEPGNARDLLKTVQKLWSNQDQLAQLAIGARKVFEEKYTADVNHKMLMEIYASAIERRKQKLS